MEIHEFDTLELARAHQVHKETFKVGSGSARGFFALNQIWKKFKVLQADVDSPLFELADTVVATATDASSFFGLDPSTRAGQGNLAGLNVLTSAGILTTTQRDEFLDLSISTTKPYADYTQGMFDLAKAKHLVAGTTSHSVNELLYNQAEAGVIGHFVNVSYRAYNFVAKLDAVTEHDSTIVITLASKDGWGTWVEEPNKISIPIKAGQQPNLKRIVQKYPRHVRVSAATIGLANTPFKLEVYGE